MGRLLEAAREAGAVGYEAIGEGTHLELVYEDGDGVELVVRVWRVSHGERRVRARGSEVSGGVGGWRWLGK